MKFSIYKITYLHGLQSDCREVQIFFHHIQLLFTNPFDYESEKNLRSELGNNNNN